MNLRTHSPEAMKWSFKYLNSREQGALPLIVWVVLIMTVAAFVGAKSVLGYKITGWAWVIPLLYSFLTIAKNPAKIKFPWKVWLPWLLILIIYLPVSEYKSLQRTMQLLCPIFVGFAVSTYSLNQVQIVSFIKKMKKLTIVIGVIALWETGIFLTGKFPWTTGLAGESMTAVLLCNLFATSYAIGNYEDIKWWVILVGITIFAVTRMAIAAAGLTLPLTFAPMSLKKRILFLVLALVSGLILFYTPRMQSKMFFSGEGEIYDIESSNFDDSGRKYMWRLLTLRIEKKPWFGYGTGSTENTILEATGGLRYPHNDWLLTLHDQGILGLACFSLCAVIAAIHAFNRATESEGVIRLMFFTGASSFLSMALIMITDNIMVYASFFGNLHFMILGLAYGARKFHAVI